MESKIMICKSCGVPMKDSSEHSCEDINSPYCVFCTTPNGVLKSKEQIREQLIKFHVKSLGMSRDEAEKKTDEHLADLPEWQEE
jgi:hypothetical protein